MDLPEEAMRAPSAPVWNQSFPSPKVQVVRGALFRNIRHNLSGLPHERLPPSATRRTRPYAVVPQRGWYRSVYNQTASDAWRYNNPVYKLMTDKPQLMLIKSLLDQFLNTKVSQGNVATHLRCDGILNHQFITQSLLSPRVKKFWKSVNICRSCGQLSTGLFFYETRCIGETWCFLQGTHNLTNSSIQVTACISCACSIYVCVSDMGHKPQPKLYAFISKNIRRTKQHEMHQILHT